MLEALGRGACTTTAAVFIKKKAKLRSRGGLLMQLPQSVFRIRSKRWRVVQKKKRHTGRKAGTRGVVKGAAGYVSNTPATLFVGILALLGFFCGVERCPRFPLRRQNKEATRSTPRTAQRAHTGLFTRLKGRVEPPPTPLPGEATASFRGFTQTRRRPTPFPDSQSGLLCGCRTGLLCVTMAAAGRGGLGL